jgi:protein-L-isoaspartate(D-aspartate) O-methyltransferase
MERSAENRRDRMVQHTIADRGVRDPAVLEAMRSVPRERFVSEVQSRHAYEDHPLPIGCGQTISQPFIVALMAEAASIRPGARVLEVGTGSGYGAAVLARLAGHVVTIERHDELAHRAASVLGELGFDNVEVVTGDGTLGWPDGAPYDAIVVTAAAQEVPPALLEQLADDGRLVIPVGRWGRSQELVCLHRRGEDIDEVDLGGVAFVPLVPDHDGD